VPGPARVEALAAEGVVIRHVPAVDALRISCGFFNTEAEIDRAVDGARAA
jgi:selenocysteine lyase/cysteine desulfurase